MIHDDPIIANIQIDHPGYENQIQTLHLPKLGPTLCMLLSKFTFPDTLTLDIDNSSMTNIDSFQIMFPNLKYIYIGNVDTSVAIDFGLLGIRKLHKQQKGSLTDINMKSNKGSELSINDVKCLFGQAELSSLRISCLDFVSNLR